MKDKGFIMLNRKLFSHRIWRASRMFSECEAWIDLIQSARFEETETTERIGYREITYGRGQFPASISFLVDRWGWTSDKKVRNFLEMLKNEGMITTDGKQGANVITLCKYDEYNSLEKGQGKRQGKGQGEGQAKGEAKGKGGGMDISIKINELEHELKELRASQKASKGQGEGQAKGEQKGNNINKDINNNISPSIPPLGGAVATAPDTGENLASKTKDKTWRDDYEVYLELVRSAYRGIQSDKPMLEKQQSYYPNVDLMKSVEKACTNFWATKEGWQHKKKSRSREIDMKMTLINAIGKNRVFNNATEQTETTKRYDNGDILR